MAIVKGARQAKRFALIGLSAAFGFILLIVAPSVRISKSPPGAVLSNTANADHPTGPDGPGPCPGPCI